MGVTFEDVGKWYIMFPKSYRPLDGKEIIIWVVSAKSCAGLTINDPRYLPRDKESLLSQKETPKTDNAKFIMTQEAVSPNQLSEFTIMAIRTTRTINSGDAIFASYGPEYDFSLGTGTEF